MRYGLGACFVVVAWLGVSLQARAQVSYSWTSAVSGNYNDNTGKWSSIPPSAGPPTSVDSATISVSGAAYIVTLNDTRSITNLTINSTDATLLQSSTYNVSGTITLSAGVYQLNGGTINGGTLLTSSGVRLTGISGTTNILNNLTLGDGTNADVLTLNNGTTYRFQGATDFRAGFTPTISAGTSVRYDATRTLNTSFILNSASSSSSIFANIAGNTLTLDVGQSITAQGAATNNLSGSGNWIINGTLQTSSTGTSLLNVVNSSGSTFTIGASGVVLAQSSSGTGTITLNRDLTNNGVIRANTGGVVNVAPGNLTTANLGTWDTTGGGLVVIANNLNNTGNTLNITTSRGNLYSSSFTITGGSILSDAGLRLIPNTGASTTLTNVTLGNATNADVLALNQSATFIMTGTTDFRSGFLPALSNGMSVRYSTTRTLNTSFTLDASTLHSNVAGQTITLDVGQSITAQGSSSSSITGLGNWINNGTIQTANTGSPSLQITNITGTTFTNSASGVVLASNTSGTSTITITRDMVNAGMLRANTGGDIVLATANPLTTANLGNWDTTGGGRVLLSTMTLNNTGDTINLTAARGNLYVQQTPTINNGTILAASGLRLTPFTSGATPILNNVTLGDGTNPDVLALNVSGSVFRFQGTTDFRTGFTPTVSNNATVGYETTRTLNTSFVLNSGTVRANTSTTTVTLDTGNTINTTGSSTILGPGSWVNNGTINANSGSLTIQSGVAGTFVNNGLIENVGAGSGLTINLFNTITNAGIIKATGGSVTISPTSTLTLAAGSQLIANGGSAQIFLPNTTLSSGTITVSATSLLKLGPSGTGTLTNNSSFINNGTTDGNVIISNTGILSGNGIITRTINVNSGGVIKPGNSPGSITVQQGITITGEYDWQLGSSTTTGPGTNFSQIVVSSGNLFIDPTLARLNILLSTPNGTLDPFWALNRQWTIIDNTGTGTTNAFFTPSQILNSIQPNGFFTTSLGGSNNNDVFLNWNAVAVPEPATWAMIILSSAGLLVGLYVYRRRIHLLFNTEVDAELELDSE